MKKKIIIISIVIVIIIALTILYARFIGTSGLIVKEYKIENYNLGEEYDGLKIVHFSDLHYGSTVDLKYLKKLVNKINDLKPDIIVFTGDLVEDNVTLSDNEVKSVIAELNRLNPTIETLAVIGNHDYDHDYWNEIVPNTNMIVLNNTYEYVYYNSKTPIRFVGFDDLRDGTPDYTNGFSYLNDDQEKKYTIILIHEPDQVEEIMEYDFDLVLAGHSHLGQVRLPGIGAIITPKGSKKYFDEQYILDENKKMYISSGVGTSLLKLRLFNRPSINLYRFYTK